MFSQKTPVGKENASFHPLTAPSLKHASFPSISISPLVASGSQKNSRSRALFQTLNNSHIFLPLDYAESPPRESDTSQQFSEKIADVSAESLCSTPRKNARNKPCNSTGQTSSSYDSSSPTEDSSALTSSYLDSSSLAMRSYLGSFDCDENEDEIDRVERSRLEELMKTPDVKTAHDLLTTLADFSPSNPFRSPLQAEPSTPVVKRTLLDSSMDHDENFCLSVKDAPRLISATSTPFASRSCNSSATKSPHKRVLEFNDQDENTILYTPDAKVAQTSVEVSVVCQTECSKLSSQTKKSNRPILPKPITPVAEQLPTAFLFVPSYYTPIDETQLSPRVFGSAVGKVKFREHSRSPVADAKFSNKSPSVTIKPFERSFGSPIQLEASSCVTVRCARTPTARNVYTSFSRPISRLSYGSPSVKTKLKHKRLSPIKPSEEILSPGMDMGVLNSSEASFKACQIYTSYCRELFKVKLRHARVKYDKKIESQTQLDSYNDVISGRTVLQRQLTGQAKLFLLKSAKIGHFNTICSETLSKNLYKS